MLHAVETSKFGYVQKAEEKAALVKAQDGAESIELALWGNWNDPERKWQAKFSTLGLRELVPAGELPAGDGVE